MSGVRQTRQRAAVSDLLNDLAEFRSAQEVHALLRERGETVGLTTVYRCLQALADGADVDVLVGDDGETRYRRCGRAHHHHLVCRDCGTTVEIAGPAVEHWANAVAADYGFSEVSHNLELFGRCATCSQH